MTSADLEVLARAHALFSGVPGEAGLAAPASPGSAMAQSAVMADAYRSAAVTAAAELTGSRRVDADFAALLAAARGDHELAARETAAVLAAARADTSAAGNPIAAREALRRNAARLRAQRRHVLTAQRRARRRRRALLALRYRLRALRAADGRAAAQRAVRAAMSRLGCPYVWGAAGPDRFDCSGLVKWAYARAGVALPRTTYDQIAAGAAVPADRIRPGDLVFPHTGHVQMAIGGGMVIEAPQPGDVVRISRLGSYVAIRRPA